MQQERGRNNATAWFGVHQIPSDQQIRNLLDPVRPEHLAPLLIDTVDGPYRLRALETHRALAGGFLLAFDGTQYFASYAIWRWKAWSITRMPALRLTAVWAMWAAAAKLR